MPVPPSYPAARSVAPIVEAHFARHLVDRSHMPGAAPPTTPTAAEVEAVIEAAFWASLRREEGYVPKISIALLRPDEAQQPMRFERPLPVDTSTLVRIAPAVERPGIH